MNGTTDFLLRAQNADGGWGYKPGGMSFVEPTAAVILALSPDAQNIVEVQRARAWLKQGQHADGGWGIAPLDTESGWMTAWAVWALAQTDADPTRRGAQWLLEISGFRVTDPGQIRGVEEYLRINPSITGWPWQPGDASWIFPSALALLALDAAGIREHPRVKEGIRYLLDRAIPGGGWNIGNPFMITDSMLPTAESTALALLALHAFRIQEERARAAQAWLAQENFTSTPFEWAWRAWYWKTTGSPLERAHGALNFLQRADGSFDGNLFTTALVQLSQEA